jgi:hypothetical protein
MLRPSVAQALVMGTKADVVERRRRGGAPAWLAAAASSACAPALRCAADVRRRLSRLSRSAARASGTGALLPEFIAREERDSHLFAAATLRSTAALGCAPGRSAKQAVPCGAHQPWTQAALRGVR